MSLLPITHELYLGLLTQYVTSSIIDVYTCRYYNNKKAYLPAISNGLLENTLEYE